MRFTTIATGSSSLFANATGTPSTGIAAIDFQTSSRVQGAMPTALRGHARHAMIDASGPRARLMRCARIENPNREEDPVIPTRDVCSAHKKEPAEDMLRPVQPFGFDAAC